MPIKHTQNVIIAKIHQVKNLLTYIKNEFHYIKMGVGGGVLIIIWHLMLKLTTKFLK